MKKSLIALLAAFTLVATACGGGNNGETNKPAATKNNTNNTENVAEAPQELVPEEGASLLIWDDPAEIPFTEAVAKEFGEKYNVQVEVIGVPAPDQAAQLANDGPAGLGPDVMMFPHDKLGTAVTSGLLFENDLFLEETKQSMPEAAIQAASFDGKLYGYPKSYETYAIFYNKDLVPEAPKTWDELIKIANDFTDSSKKQYGFMFEMKTLYYNYGFLAANGGYTFGQNGTDANDIGLNNAGAVEGAKFFQSLNKVVPLKVEDVTWNIKSQLFQDGKLAMNMDGTWAISSFKDKLNYGVAPLPKLPGDKVHTSYAGIRSYYVSSYTQYPIAAKMLANYLTNKENALKNFQVTGILPANKEAAEDPAIKNDPVLNGFMEQFKNAVPMPSIPAMNNVWGPIEAAFTTMWNDNIDPQKALDDAVAAIKELNASAN